MKITELMTRDVETITPDTTLQDAAKLMAVTDIGALPIVENDRLIGIVTDRDIAVRAVAAGAHPATARVRDIMSAEVKYAFEDENVSDIGETMADFQLRRLPIVSREQRVVGIVSIGDLAQEQRPRKSGEILRGISRPGANPAA